MQLSGLKQRCQGDLIGFSLGEGIQCAAAGLPEERYQLRDARIKRAIAMNPIASLLFGETGLSAIQIPTLIVAFSRQNNSRLSRTNCHIPKNSISQMASRFCRRNPLKRQRSEYNFKPSSHAEYSN